MASIAGNTFAAMRGTIQPFGERVERFLRPGVDGQAYRRGGREGGPTILLTVTDHTGNDEVLLASYRALMGTLATIVDQRGHTHDNVAILFVEAAENQRVLSPVGGLVGAAGVGVLMCRWEVEATQ